MKEIALNQEAPNLTGKVKKSRNRLGWKPEEDRLILEVLSKDPQIHWVHLADLINERFHKKKIRSSKQVKARWLQVIKPAQELPLNPDQQSQIESLLNKYKLCSRVLWWKLKEAFPELKHKQIKAHVVACREKVVWKQKSSLDNSHVQNSINLLCYKLESV